MRWAYTQASLKVVNQLDRTKTVEVLCFLLERSMTCFIKYSIRNVVVGFLSVILLLSGVSENAFFDEKTQASFCLEQRAKKERQAAGIQSV